MTRAAYLEVERLARDLAALDPAAVAAMDPARRAELNNLIAECDRRLKQGKFYRYFPDETFRGPDGVYYARHLYPKQVEFFRAGTRYMERCFLAANRVGKTDSGGYEAACHLTGEYPDWWEGRRFDGPIEAWVAGDTNETVRDIIQPKLLGSVNELKGRKTLDGTGLIPGDAIVGTPTWRQGVPDTVDTVRVRHVNGGYSTLTLKSYQQGRFAFQGTAKHLVWLDEECPEDIYGECLMRIMTTNGILMLTFTPLKGLTPTVLQFLPGVAPDRA